MLKKISAVLVAGLFATAFAAGCKKKDAAGGGDCDAVAARAKKENLAKVKADAPPEQKKMEEEMATKGADLIAKHCKADKWSADAIKCGKESKNPEECMSKLSPEQQKAFMDDAMKMMGGAIPKEEPPKEEPPTGEGSGTAAGSAEGSAAGSAEGSAAGSGEGSAAAGGEGTTANTGLPNCDAYVAAVEKYVACDKVPQEARDGAKSGIEAMKQGWGDMAGMPDDAKKQTDDACKSAVDALKQGASAMGCEI